MAVQDDWTLSDFMGMEVIRHPGDDKADIVVDYYKGRPITMIGFDASLTDNEIREVAYHYYLDLKTLAVNG